MNSGYLKYNPNRTSFFRTTYYLKPKRNNDLFSLWPR